MPARTLRVASQLQRALNDLLRGDVKDPRLWGVSVTEVRVSGDIRVARVFFSTLDPDADPEPVFESLERASGYLRSRVAGLLRLRHTPELRFSLDEGSKRGLQLTRLIDAAARESAREEASGGESSGAEPRQPDGESTGGESSLPGAESSLPGGEPSA